MNITAIDASAAENLIVNYNMQWKLSFQKIKRQFWTTYAVFGVMLLIGFYELFKNEVPTNASIHVPIDAIFLSIGSTMLYLTFHRHYTYIKFNKSNLVHLQVVSSEMGKGDNQQVLHLTEEFISLKYHNCNSKIGWEYFNYYSIYDEFVILHQNTKIIQNYVIKRDQITSSEFEDLLFFLHENLDRHIY